MKVIGFAAASLGSMVLVATGGGTGATGREVTYIPSEKVTAAFVKGMPLAETLHLS